MKTFLVIGLGFLPFILTAQTDTILTFLFAHESIEPLDFSSQFSQKILVPGNQIRLNSVQITGYCDDEGTNQFNDSLSLWRARRIKSLLLKSGLPDSIPVQVSGRGKRDIVQKEMNNQQLSDLNRQQSRKVEVTFQYKAQKPVPTRVQNLESLFTSDAVEGTIVTLKNIQFPSGSHVILPESYGVLKQLLVLLNEHPETKLDILGHVCCERNGQDSFDYDSQSGNLSYNRAKTVYDYLVREGIDPTRLKCYGMKSAFKLGLGDGKDMRVEVRLRK